MNNQTITTVPTTPKLTNSPAGHECKPTPVGQSNVPMTQDRGIATPDKVLAPMEEETPSFWVEKISHSVRNVVGWCVITGQQLIRAKKKLGHGRWMQLFEPGGLKFGIRTAEVLMAIAGHPYLGNSQNYANLPASYAAMYELSRLDAGMIQHGVTQGMISPGTTIAEAKRFVRANQDAPATPAASQVFHVEKRLKKVNNYFLKELGKWPGEHHAGLADLLEKLAAEIRSALDSQEKLS